MKFSSSMSIFTLNPSGPVARPPNLHLNRKRFDRLSVLKCVLCWLTLILLYFSVNITHVADFFPYQNNLL